MIEYFLANMWQVWAIVAIICLILELSSGDFFIICFSIGGVFALIGAALGINIYWQLFVFAIFSLLSVIFVRPVALRWLHKNDPNKASNADALLGRTGRVTEEIKALKKLCGERVLKVIVETCFLTEEEKIAACKCVTEAGADFIKTSTGFGSAGATLEDIKLFKEHIGPKVQMKAAGGIHTREEMEAFIEAGCTRLGASAAVKVLKDEV